MSYNLRALQDKVNILLGRESIHLTLHRHSAANKVTITISRVQFKERGGTEVIHREMVVTDEDISNAF
jgi:hypothetical protein